MNLWIQVTAGKLLRTKFKFQSSALMTNGTYPIHLLTKLEDVK